MNQPLVVGYKGEIGSFILNGLLRVMPKALDIWCIDINETKEEVEHRIKMSDVIFLCVPMQMTVDWLVEHKDLLKNKMVIEQCSLKEWIYEDERLQGLDLVSMHILFRPSQTPNLEDRKVGFVKGQFDDGFAKYIADTIQSQVVWYNDLKEHDMEMAIQQALTHRVLLILGQKLKACNGSTYIGKKVIELADRIRKGDLKLYRSIQCNKYLKEHLEEMENGLVNFDLGDYF
jgi:prephenate dehydrogenase